MAMLFASCCTHSTTNDSDVVTVKDGEQRLGAEQAEQGAILELWGNYRCEKDRQGCG